jgi:predicted alpha/beta superfamily hydrolase
MGADTVLVTGRSERGGPEQAWRRVPPHNDRDVFHYRSDSLGDDLVVTVVPPPVAANGPAPVLFVLDPFLTLEVVVGWSRVYGLYANGTVPLSYVVGIGHRHEDEPDFMARRIRDLTPTPVTARQWRPPLGAGQGPRFLSAITSEIIPFIESNYPVSTDRTIVGWSLGGLFALYALFHEPRAFSRYLVVSPSLWWENRLPLAWEKSWAETRRDLPARVFMAVGSEEEAPGGGWLSEDFSDELIAWFAQVTNFRRFTEALAARHHPSLALDTVIFPDEYHMTVYPAAVGRGLVRLFKPG